MTATGRAVPTDDLVRLLAQARYARERYNLYRARVYGSRPTSAGHLRQLERECELAESRLRRAQVKLSS